MNNVGVANMKSGEYHFPISSVALPGLIYGIVYTLELVQCLIIQRFL